MKVELSRSRCLPMLLASVAVLFSCGSPLPEEAAPGNGTNQESNLDDAVDPAEKLAHMVDLGPPKSSPGTVVTPQPGVRAASVHAAGTTATATPIPFAPEPSPSTRAPYVNACDDCVSGLLPIGFDFTFFGNTYQQFNISSNGFIGFDEGMSQGCCSGRPIPSNDGSYLSNIIAAAWTDLYPRASGAAVGYATRGTAPNRRLIVEWKDVPWCCSQTPPRVTTQIILYESTNVIEIHTSYQDAGHTYTQGVENADGTQGAVIAGRSSANYALTRDAVRFTTPGSTNRAPTVVIGGPYTGTEGSALTLNWAASDPDGDPLTYAWDFGDGTTGSGPNLPQAHTYADNGPGTYTLRLTATDSKGNQDTKTTSVTIANVAPGVYAGPDATRLRGQTFTLHGSIHDPGKNDAPWSYTVQWGDGTSTSGTFAGPGNVLTARHAYALPGSFPVVLSVTDKDGATGTSQLVVQVVNQSPVASAGGPYTADEGSPFTLNGSGVDPDGDALTFSWLFGDGQSGTGPSPLHAYGDSGSYTASLTVSDEYGGSDVKTASVTILNVAPTATFEHVAHIPEGSTFSLALMNPVDPSFADAVAGFTHAFDCGTGYGATGSAAMASCSAEDDALLTVGGRIGDKDDGVTAYSGTVQVLNVAPTVNAGADVTLYSGASLDVQASFSDPGLKDTWSYTIDWGTGAPSTGSTATQGSITASHGYLAAGTYTVVVTVTDDDGGSHSDALQVTVLRNPARVDIKPGSSENPIKLNDKSNGLLPVALLTTATLDAAQVDAASLTLGNESGTDTAVARRNNGSLMASLEDVDGDGAQDLVLHFERAALQSNGDLTSTTTQLSLLGVLNDGRQFRGTDSVRVIP